MEEKVKKSGKKIAIISMVILLVIIGAGIGGYFVYEAMELKKPISTQWGETYYSYTKEVATTENEEEKNSSGLNNLENAKIQFCEIDKDEVPVMVVSYFKDGQEYSNIYYIEEGKVNNRIYNEPSKVELLYNIERQEYIWYVNTNTETKEEYTPVKNIVEIGIRKGLASGETIEDPTEIAKVVENVELLTESKEYVFENGAETSIETLEGEKIGISKFDEMLIRPDVNVNEVDFSINSTEKEMKKAMESGVQGYQTQEQIATEEVKQEVAKKEAELTEQKQRIEMAKEEIRKKEEEERKITSENIQAKIGENLKWFVVAYLGTDYGLPTVYKINDVTGTVSIPGVSDKYEGTMTEEVVGLKSIQVLKNQVSTYVSASTISKINQKGNGSYTTGLHDYNGKVYIARMGIGSGPEIDIKKARVISSENGISKVQIDEIDSLGGTLTTTITLTIEHNIETSQYMITNYSDRFNP